MLGATEADLEFSVAVERVVVLVGDGHGARQRPSSFSGWGRGTNVTRNERIRQAMVDAFQSGDMEPYQLPLPMITVGSIMAMIMLRRRITDGTALASEVAEFERLSAERLTGVEEAMARRRSMS